MINNLHSEAPGPHLVLQTVHLLGGPLDGSRMPTPVDCIEFYSDPGSTGARRHHYRYCPHASARLDKPCFIHATIAHDLYAR